jgi:poly-beta-1,6-N-acetyl-D-glucosamine synthase
MNLVFWIAAIALVYTYAGYPALVWLWSRLRERPLWLSTRLPRVTVVTVAQDEELYIDERIQNLLALDYPPELLEIVVASDGSRDGTAARARAYAGAGVLVLPFAARRGKAATLTDAVHWASGEILLLCDTRQHIDRGAVRALVAAFGDSRVGAVSGLLVLPGSHGAVGKGLGLYWRLETFLRACESRIDSMIGATGALYAVRRHLFEPLPPDTLLDDVVVPLRVVRRGYRTVLEPRAFAVDKSGDDPRREFARKVRTLAGCFQLFVRERWLFDPRQNRVWLQTLSHKGLRLLGPLWMLLAFVGCVTLSAQPLYRVLLVAQLAFYAAALAGFALQRSGRVRALGAAWTFCLLQAAVVVGFFRYLGRTQPVVWKQARRP